ncbi:DUF4389 domain-containing protein [Kitasatospora azatica]|uniref:DUF4389 domain-containing protein n=1 Tax=Kitasatospora azatica TaxID=58347 RepID=UPI0006899425|nr:DUF4389 domain-containing protein [Kitasatospora azatica]
MAQTAGGWAVPVSASEPEFLPVLDVPEPGRQRRLTVFFRWLILIPHDIVLWVLSIAACFVVIVGWFAALFTGRLPASIARFLTNYLGYDSRLMASQTLLIDRYPPFSLRQPRDYPVRIEVLPGRLNRAAVFFRLILMFPAAIINSLASAGWFVLAFFFWLWVLIAGEMPHPIFEATAAVVRYRMRFTAYALLLTAAYPKGLFGEERGTEEPQSATRPLVLGGLAKGLVVAFLLLGLGSDLAGSIGGNSSDSTDGTTINTAPLIPSR